jgi:hypothetical protein
MDKYFQYHGLQFTRQRRLISPRLIFIGSTLLGLVLVCIAAPQGAVVWILLPLVGGLAWAASYGWRSTLLVIHETIHRIDGR